MSFVRQMSGRMLAVTVCGLLFAALSVSTVSGQTVYTQSNTLYSFESPAITTVEPNCGSQWPAFCVFRYYAGLGGAPTADQPWIWNNGGIATQGSAWDPAGANGPFPPNGAQFAFIQCNSDHPTSAMITYATLSPLRSYYVNYSIATRGSGYTIDPSTQFTLTANAGFPVTISSAVPPTGQQWSASSNPVLSDVFTMPNNSLARLQFTMSVSNTVDQAVVIDAVSILPVALVPEVTYSFEVPALADGGYQYSPALSAVQPFFWTTNGGIAHQNSPWDSQNHVVLDGKQYAYLQASNHPGGSSDSAMEAYVTGLQTGLLYYVSWDYGFRYTGCGSTSGPTCTNLTYAQLFTSIKTIGGQHDGTSQYLYSKAAGNPNSSNPPPPIVQPVITSDFGTHVNSVVFRAQSPDALLIFDLFFHTPPFPSYVANDGTYDCAWLIDSVRVSLSPNQT